MITLRTPHRAKPTWLQLFNPLWLCTDDKIDPGWSGLGWFLRNPFANLFAVVIGVAHKDRATVTLNGIDSYPTSGFQFGWTLTTRKMIPVVLPWIAYRGKHFECGHGWKMDGCFTLLCFRKAHSKNATEVKPS